MKICFIADARSPITRGWVDLVRQNHDVVVLSTFPSHQPWDGVQVIDLRFMNWLYKPGEKNQIERSKASGLLRYVYDVFLLRRKACVMAKQVRRFVADWKPDLIHALRIPAEGQIAALAGSRPLIVSVWGNDFTLHAPKSKRNRELTCKAVAHSSALLADCHADIARAKEFGLRNDQLTAVLPGGGGIATRNGQVDENSVRQKFALPAGHPIVINPRGARAYVRTDTFLKAVNIVHQVMPEVLFVGVGLKGYVPADEAVATQSLSGTLLLTSHVDRTDLLDLMSASEISVSMATHDGTPNSLLEAMSSGAFPICGDLPSIREWVEDGTNGMLVDPSNAEMLANAILRALRDQGLKHRAKALNAEIIRTRADRRSTRQAADSFYQSVLSSSRKLPQ